MFEREALGQLRERGERYHKNLLEDDAALAYLAGRGISLPLAAKYGLGISDDVHAGRLAIPYLRPNGVIWFNYRSLDGAAPKYIASGAKHMFNTAVLDEADVTGEIAICEGELDAIVATELFGVPAVAIPGATQWQGNRHWHELFRGYQRVWVLADPDEAGLGLADRILETLPAARLVRLPADVTDTWLTGKDLREYMT